MLRLAACAAAFSLLAGSAARADEFFDAYQSYCVKHRAEPEAALAAATAAGWQPVPASLLDGFSGDLDGVDGRMRSAREGLSIVVVADQTRQISGEKLKFRFCAVGALPQREAGPLKAALAQWAAVAPDPTLSKGESLFAYAFTDEGGVHKIIENPDDATALALVRSGKANFAVLSTEANFTMLAFAVPTSATSAR